jgi:hypothetical protein
MGADSRKQAISIRMSRADVRNIKRLAERLGARDSDVIRFAIKLMLARLSPLQDPGVSGRGLVPVFLEWGPELMRHFELDASTLTSIINEGVPEERRVDPDDVQLIAMNGVQRAYRQPQVDELRSNGADGSMVFSLHRPATSGASGRAVDGDDTEPPGKSIRSYLYDKYLRFGTDGLRHGTDEKP